MKIANDTSTLFVKQDLFANPSAKKASNATDKELDNVLIVDRNQTDRDIFGDSYDVKLDSQKLSNTPGTINAGGDYGIWETKTGDIYGIELRIQNALSASSIQNDEVYAFEMKQLARDLNQYMSFQPNDYDPKQDTYMQSLKDRFDAIDPDQQDTRINLMRDMIDTVQNGNTIHIKDDEFVRKIKESAIAPTTIISPNTKKNNISNKDNDNFISQQIQSYKISMTQAQNEASLMSKLLDVNTSSNNVSAADILKFDSNNKDKNYSVEMRDKIHELDDDDSFANLDNKQSTSSNEQTDSKATITAIYWNAVTKNYAVEHEKDIPIVLEAYQFNATYSSSKYML